MSAREEYEAVEATRIEQTKAAICDLCHYPYREKDQSALDAICETCKAMAMLDMTVQLIKTGREVIGGIDATREAREIVGIRLQKKD